MSKIFDAYKKKASQSPTGRPSELAAEIGQVGTITLFPSPAGNQSEDFNKLANRILGLRRDERGSVLAFGSSAAGEGASFVSYNTALVLSRIYHQKVVWIDGNFLSPQKKLIGHSTNTFSGLLQDPARVEDMVMSENPMLIEGGSDLMGAKGRLADRNYSELLTALTKKFDFVILDLPPVLNSTDTALMAESADGFLLVIEQKFLKREVIEHGLQGLREKNVRLLGSVINRRTFELPKVIYNRL
ncbi:MAG: Mrp family chromosome partitioning ATPase [Candidatus Azotimanducaceae bacterium]|jgi:Mrp family chromosome partitioning ATPase